MQRKHLIIFLSCILPKLAYVLVIFFAINTTLVLKSVSLLFLYLYFASDADLWVLKRSLCPTLGNPSCSYIFLYKILPKCIDQLLQKTVYIILYVKLLQIFLEWGLDQMSSRGPFQPQSFSDFGKEQGRKCGMQGHFYSTNEYVKKKMTCIKEVVSVNPKNKFTSFDLQRYFLLAACLAQLQHARKNVFVQPRMNCGTSLILLII